LAEVDLVMSSNIGNLFLFLWFPLGSLVSCIPSS